MTASIVVPAHFNLREIARLAGVTDPDAMFYTGETFHLEGVEQAALEQALIDYTQGEDPKNRLKKLIAGYRYDVETAGIMVGGFAIESNRESQALITGATVQAVIDPTYVVRWKTPTGFIELDAQAIIGIATTMRQHVQSCFDREEELVTAVDNGTFTEEMLVQGWPPTVTQHGMLSEQRVSPSM